MIEKGYLLSTNMWARELAQCIFSVTGAEFCKSLQGAADPRSFSVFFFGKVDVSVSVSVSLINFLFVGLNPGNGHIANNNGGRWRETAICYCRRK